MRRPTTVRYLALMLALLASCAACGGARPPSHRPHPAGGSVAGMLVSQKSDGSDRAPLAGRTVGAFTEVVIPGKPVQHPPAPVRTAVTAPDGRFEIQGLRPGRYFIAAADPQLRVPGKWARVTSRRGAFVLLVRCTDCPGPL